MGMCAEIVFLPVMRLQSLLDKLESVRDLLDASSAFTECHLRTLQQSQRRRR